MREEKDKLRAKAKAIRAALDREKISKEIVSLIRDWEIYKNAEHILSYSAFGSEFDLSPLYKDKKNFYITRTNKDLSLSIHELESKMEKHKYGYWQPVKNAKAIEPNRMDLVLVPGLAFSKNGARLGYGKGYYDRLLAKMAGVKFAGVCARAQIFSQLPQHKNDVKLHYLITEKEIIPTNV